MIVASALTCRCCAQSRGYIYAGPVYGDDDLHESLCPWCIADGSAASKLGASFADSHPLLKAGIAPEIVDEVNLRTPSYISWQQEEWLSHCNDACEFHGDAAIADVRDAAEQTKRLWIERYHQNEEGWIRATKGYSPKGDSAFYKFVCRHCGEILLGWDLS